MVVLTSSGQINHFNVQRRWWKLRLRRMNYLQHLQSKKYTKLWDW